MEQPDPILLVAQVRVAGLVQRGMPVWSCCYTGVLCSSCCAKEAANNSSILQSLVVCCVQLRQPVCVRHVSVLPHRFATHISSSSMSGPRSHDAVVSISSSRYDEAVASAALAWRLDAQGHDCRAQC